MKEIRQRKHSWGVSLGRELQFLECKCRFFLKLEKYIFIYGKQISCISKYKSRRIVSLPTLFSLLPVSSIYSLSFFISSIFFLTMASLLTYIVFWFLHDSHCNWSDMKPHLEFICISWWLVILSNFSQMSVGISHFERCIFVPFAHVLTALFGLLV